MAFLDFLGGANPFGAKGTPFNPNAPVETGALGGIDPTEMGAAGPMPQAEKPEGFLSKVFGTGDDGVTFADKLYATGGILQNDPNAMIGISDKRKEFKAEGAKRALEEKQAAQRAKQATALRQAYQNGRFNPQAYIEAMAGDVTADELGGFTKLAPKAGVDGGFAYTQDPFSGETQFGAQRPMSYNEQIAEDRLDEQERRNQVLEQIAMGNLGVRQGQLGLGQQRERRVASQPKGGAGQGAAPDLSAIEAELRRRGALK